jgi:RNA polymerase sigma-70 factor (ECF subfamily)
VNRGASNDGIRVTETTEIRAEFTERKSYLRLLCETSVHSVSKNFRPVSVFSVTKKTMPQTVDQASDEIRLLADVADGDRAAFRELYTRYSAPLFSLAVRLLGDNGAAEEALQDAFVKIWRHAGDYDPRKSRPFTWAVTILRRTCIDYLRKHRRAPLAVPLPDDDSAATELYTRENIRRTAETRETTELVRSTLSTIAQPQRSALELALYSTLTHSEIAARLSQPVGTIKTWIRRGLLDLRAALKEATP